MYYATSTLLAKTNISHSTQLMDNKFKKIAFCYAYLSNKTRSLWSCTTTTLS